MSNALFPTVSAANYPEFKTLLPDDAGESFQQWVLSVYTRMSDHLAGRHGADVMTIEIEPSAARSYFRAQGSPTPGLTELTNYAWTLVQSYQPTDPEEFWRQNGSPGR